MSVSIDFFSALFFFFFFSFQTQHCHIIVAQVKWHSQESHPGYNPWRKNQQYMQIASGISGEFTFVVALEGCQFTTPGHIVQVSLVVGDCTL